MKLIMAVMVTVMLSACGTVAGLGSDIKGASEWTRDQMTGEKVKL